MATLRAQVLAEVTATLQDTDELAEALEFDGQTLTGIIGQQQLTMLGGAWNGEARGQTVLRILRADLTSVPGIGEMTTLNGVEMMVIDRSERIAGVLVYVLQ